MTEVCILTTKNSLASLWYITSSLRSLSAGSAPRCTDSFAFLWTGRNRHDKFHFWLLLDTFGKQATKLYLMEKEEPHPFLSVSPRGKQTSPLEIPPAPPPQFTSRNLSLTFMWGLSLRKKEVSSLERH